ncbi:exodeoxyribonuclease VII small subunit [Pararhodospirillum photometricum]|uniref:Exodeoxyribonuclease 7 small subunit n=1 Tax=Pararhodospirillum photometricum DSM 122 TaxID=1150469 RepID=H6SJA8_PARPM|nr:exodeoxyribonuclease VII small subunit [Pararhodospirillum photometricum]CCG08073.1 Exodeoxyribonuclease VII small subunit [Pararhodospirillum photometricum DSM 122]
MSTTATSSPARPPVPPDLGSLSFEQALAELETIVRDLEQGSVELDKAVGAYERGVALRRHCEARLNEARMTVERIAAGPDGEPVARPFDAG